MASRIMSILKMLGPRSVASSRSPNSWAELSMWRRFFEIKEAEEQENIDVLAEGLEDAMGVESARPIASEAATEARAECIREHRNAQRVALPNQQNDSLQTRSSNQSFSESRNRYSVMQEHERQQLHNPNLDIPSQDGTAYVSLAQ